MNRQVAKTSAPDRLTPATPNAVLLPGIETRSGSPAGLTVLHTYKNGLAITDDVSVIEGYGAAFGTLALLIGIPMWVTGLTEGYYFELVMQSAAVLMTAVMVLFDCTGYREQPTLFDRAAGRIYVMHSQRDWLHPWRWFRIPVSVQVFEWSRIRAMIVATQGIGGTGAPRTNYTLRLVQTDVPNGTRIVASFGVGISSAYDGGAEPAALWEHLRRFMQEGGPHLGPHDVLYVDDSSPSRLWNALWWWQPLLGPGAGQFWIGPYWFLTIPFGLFTLPCLPLTMAGGFIRWLSYCCKRPAPWPAEVLASIGPALAPRELARAKR